MMNQKQILFVEDEAAIILPLRYALEREGWNVSWANTGAQALQYLSEQAFDFIILDVGLPDQNGFEVCKQLRQKYQTPLLFLTARDDEIDRVVGLEIGADDYCTKPFSAREIVARIKAIWRRMEIQAQNISSQPSVSKVEIVSVQDSVVKTPIKLEELPEAIKTVLQTDPYKAWTPTAAFSVKDGSKSYFQVDVKKEEETA